MAYAKGGDKDISVFGVSMRLSFLNIYVDGVFQEIIAKFANRK
jgi:hypothetical protein